YDQHALRAFEVNALDYLVKPIDPRRLAAAIRRLRPPEAAGSPSGPLEQLFVRDGPRCWFVPLREVRLVAAYGNYTRLVWREAEPLVPRSLVSIEERLDPRTFVRANRKEILNVDFIESVELGAGGRLYVALRGGPEVEVSRRQTRAFRA